MANIPRKALLTRVGPDSTNELFSAEVQIPVDVVPRRGKKQCRPTSKDITTSIHVLTALIGNTNSPYRKLSRIGLLLWLLNMALNSIWDGYESRARYGYPWLCVRGLLWITCCVCTWFTIFRTVPWLEQGVSKLESDKQYREVLRHISRSTKKLPYFLALFSIIAGSLQYGMMQRDQATHLSFGQSPHLALGVVLHVLRFISGVHVFYALALFWCVPTCVMLITGYSMIEYQELTQTRLKNKETSITLKHAVESYKERVQFVKDSSSSCMVLLCMLIAFTVVSLAVNVYVFLFIHRSSFLYIVHALLPLALAAYPLSTASWVTKQYHWHLIAVVQAWVDISDSETDSDNDLPPERYTSSSNSEHALKGSPPETPVRIHTRPDTGCITVKPYRSNNVGKLRNVFIESTRFVGKLQRRRKFSQKFEFEKYIMYLEKVSRNEGFSIGVVLVTWELVSAVFFFLTSLIAVFLQESIFGQAESTINI